ncbi:MAG: diguanylate cyclase [Bacillota bacterium]|nr:diguanylate cyclase [Bacillota bacterium]
MKNYIYRNLFTKGDIGYAYYKVLYDKEGMANDFKCLEANDIYHQFVAASAGQIIGKTLSESGAETASLIERFKSIASAGGGEDFHFLCEASGRRYRVTAITPRVGYLAALFVGQSAPGGELSDFEEQMKVILEATTEGIYVVDTNGYCVLCNSSCLRLLGYSRPEELIGKDMNKIMHHHHFGQPTDFVNDIIDRLFSNKSKHAEHEVFLRKDGTYFYAEYNSYPYFHDGKVKGAVIAFSDITGRMTVEHELKESERSKTVLLENLPGMAYRCKFDPDWTMEFVSQGCYELTGYRSESILNNREVSYGEIIKAEFRKPIWEKWNGLIGTTDKFREEYIIVTATGEEKWVLEQGQFVYDADGEVVAVEGLIIDITDQKNKQKEIEYLSYHDHLTGLYNRIYFDQIRKKFDSPEYLPLSLIVGDINGLKLLNDALGHQEGDALIIRTANVLKSCCQKDHVLARTGGDEFSILMPKTDSYRANAMLKRIRRACDEYNKQIRNEVFHINLAIGFATKTQPNEPYSKIRKIAEDYMYKRKLLERKSSHSAIISSIKSTVYARSQETEEHAERMQHLSRLVGLRLGLSEVELDELSLLAALHDIGKVGIDDNILKKPGQLTAEEWIEMKKHPEIGYRIAMASPELMSIANYILCHHERWDGKGYPQGLKGKQIPLFSRIISIIDAYDAMTEDRPYRSALTHDEALEEIKINAGTQFDPEAARIFIEVMNNEFGKKK